MLRTITNMVRSLLPNLISLTPSGLKLLMLQLTFLISFPLRLFTTLLLMKFCSILPPLTPTFMSSVVFVTRILPPLLPTSSLLALSPVCFLVILLPKKASAASIPPPAESSFLAISRLTSSPSLSNLPRLLLPCRLSLPTMPTTINSFRSLHFLLRRSLVRTLCLLPTSCRRPLPPYRLLTSSGSPFRLPRPHLLQLHDLLILTPSPLLTL